MFQLLLFYYILSENTNVRLFRYSVVYDKIYLYEGKASDIPDNLYHEWVHELFIDDYGFLCINITSEPIEELLEDASLVDNIVSGYAKYF